MAEGRGQCQELRKAADDLDVLMESNRQIYLERINITEEELIQMMEDETFLTPEKAVEMGFADEVDKAAEPVPNLTQQLQQQLMQVRREVIAQKSFREEMEQFCKGVMKKKDDGDTDDQDAGDEDTEDEDTDGDSGGADNNGDDTDSTDSDDDEDEEDDKKQRAAGQFSLAALLGQAAAQYLKER